MRHFLIFEPSASGNRVSTLVSMILSAEMAAFAFSSEEASASTLRRFARRTPGCPGRPRRDGGVGSHTMSRRAQRPHGVPMSHLTLDLRQATHVVRGGDDAAGSGGRVSCARGPH